MLSLPDTLFAPFLGLGFTLHMGIKKLAAGEHAQGYPTSCILVPSDVWGPATPQRTVVWGESSHFSDAVRLVPGSDFPSFSAVKIQEESRRINS